MLEANGHPVSDQEAPLMEKISILLHERLITPEIEKIMQRTRRMRNETTHARRDFSAYDCDRHLEDIYKLAVWFVNVYVDPDFVASNYISMTGQATLIYTACTRAKERLLITGVGKLVEQLPLYNGLCNANFTLDNLSGRDTEITIEELSAEEDGTSMTNESQGKVLETKESQEKDSLALKEKQVVAHNKYGVSKIEAIKGNYVFIDFEGETRKFVYPNCVERGYIRINL